MGRVMITNGGGHHVQGEVRAVRLGALLSGHHRGTGTARSPARGHRELLVRHVASRFAVEAA